MELEYLTESAVLGNFSSLQAAAPLCMSQCTKRFCVCRQTHLCIPHMITQVNACMNASVVIPYPIAETISTCPELKSALIGKGEKGWWEVSPANAET